MPQINRSSSRTPIYVFFVSEVNEGNFGPDPIKEFVKKLRMQNFIKNFDVKFVLIDDDHELFQKIETEVNKWHVEISSIEIKEDEKIKKPEKKDEEEEFQFEYRKNEYYESQEVKGKLRKLEEIIKNFINKKFPKFKNQKNILMYSESQEWADENVLKTFKSVFFVERLKTWIKHINDSTEIKPDTDIFHEISLFLPKIKESNNEVRAKAGKAILVASPALLYALMNGISGGGFGKEFVLFFYNWAGATLDENDQESTRSFFAAFIIAYNWAINVVSLEKSRQFAVIQIEKIWNDKGVKNKATALGKLLGLFTASFVFNLPYLQMLKETFSKPEYSRFEAPLVANGMACQMAATLRALYATIDLAEWKISRRDEYAAAVVIKKRLLKILLPDVPDNKLESLTEGNPFTIKGDLYYLSPSARKKIYIIMAIFVALYTGMNSFTPAVKGTIGLFNGFETDDDNLFNHNPLELIAMFLLVASELIFGRFAFLYLLASIPVCFILFGEEILPRKRSRLEKFLLRSYYALLIIGGFISIFGAVGFIYEYCWAYAEDAIASVIGNTLATLTTYTLSTLFALPVAFLFNVNDGNNAMKLAGLFILDLIFSLFSNYQFRMNRIYGTTHAENINEVVIMLSQMSPAAVLKLFFEKFTPEQKAIINNETREVMEQIKGRSCVRNGTEVYGWEKPELRQLAGKLNIFVNPDNHAYRFFTHEVSGQPIKETKDIESQEGKSFTTVKNPTEKTRLLGKKGRFDKHYSDSSSEDSGEENGNSSSDDDSSDHTSDNNFGT